MSKTLPKYNWNLNCLSYGSNLLIKLDNVDILRTQFDKFESHFRNNENVIYDEKMPLFIMEAFSRLWKLWIDFPELRKIIPPSSFYNVFEEMSSYFASEKDQSRQTAAAEKAISISPVEKTRQPTATHYVLLDKFQGCGQYPAQPNKPFAVPCPNLTVDKVNRSPTAFVHLNPDPGNKRSIEIESCLSNNSSRFPKSATNEIENFQSSAILRSSTPHQNFHWTAGSFEENNVLFKIPSRHDMHCGPCCRIVTDEETIEEHLNSAKHRKHVEMMRDCVRCLDKNRHVLTLQDKRTMRFVCKACVKIQEGTNCLIQHCNSKNHLNVMTNRLKDFNSHFLPKFKQGCIDLDSF